MDTNIRPLNILYRKLDSLLYPKDVDKLKEELVPKHINVADIDRLKSANAVFHYLERRGLIATNDLDLLIKVFNNLQLLSLVEEIKSFLTGRPEEYSLSSNSPPRKTQGRPTSSRRTEEEGQPASKVPKIMKADDSPSSSNDRIITQEHGETEETRVTEHTMSSPVSSDEISRKAPPIETQGDTIGEQYASSQRQQ
ncbi:uncharacterized protein [Ptychodera flava]|uniref:uncharacterized protein isoform X1 n=1 Tax=Ptychodera flava TaxID=63121 RepID=UPI00396A0810